VRPISTGMPKPLSHKARQREHAEVRAEVLQSQALELRLAALKSRSVFVLDNYPKLSHISAVLPHEGRARGVGCGGGMRFWPLRDKTLVPHARALSGGNEAFGLFGQAGVGDLPSLASPRIVIKGCVREAP
jgi:hypothetical protein